jgi:hypothetical protein
METSSRLEQLPSKILFRRFHETGAGEIIACRFTLGQKLFRKGAYGGSGLSINCPIVLKNRGKRNTEMRISTKKGDTGRTSLLDTRRGTPKTDIRREIKGTLDEVNSVKRSLSISLSCPSSCPLVP